MTDFREQERKFQKQIVQHINKAIPQLLNKSFSSINLSSTYEDTTLSYDMIFKMQFTISVRIRSNKYIHWNDLTIRSKGKNNGKTELDKIMEGKAQIYFYAYMTKDYDDLEKIYICNVEALRNLYKSNNFNKEMYNKDGSGFIGFDLKNIENESIKNNYLYYKSNKIE